MRDIIRPAEPGRFAFIFLIFILSLSVCLGQEPPPATDKGAAQAAATPPTVDSGTAVPDAVKPQDTPKPQEPQAAPPPPPLAAPAPAVAATKGKGKSAPKKGKGAQDQGTGGGSVAFTDVQKKPYEIGPEDILYINVLHQNEVSGNVEVRPDGFVSIRFVGEMMANGLTTPQLADQVTEKLKKYFNNPEVNIQVVSIRSKKYYISGEVKKAGAYSLSTPKTAFEALIEAGGPAEFAKTKGIYILRNQQKIPFNYKDVSRGKNLGQNILLQNGDVIVVP